MERDPVARARQILSLPKSADAATRAMLEAELASPQVLPRWAAAVALFRVLGPSVPPRAIEILADSHVAAPPETRAGADADQLFNDNFVHPLDLDRRHAALVVGRLLAGLDDLDPVAIGRNERTRAVRVLEVILWLTFTPSEKPREEPSFSDLERKVLTTLATHREAERWWRICWPPVWWYFGLPDSPSAALPLLGRASTGKVTAMDDRVSISRDEYWRHISVLKARRPSKAAGMSEESILPLGAVPPKDYLSYVDPTSLGEGENAASDGKVIAIPNAKDEMAGMEELLIAVLPQEPGYLYRVRDRGIVRSRLPAEH